MKFYYKLLIVVLASFALLLPACKDDCPVEPDPCSVYPEKMEILIEWQNKQRSTSRDIEYVDTKDSIFTPTIYLIFKTNYAYDSIIWQIGSSSDQIKRNKVNIGFDKRVLNNSVKIAAVCFRAINRDCFGQSDDGIDTLQKRINFQSQFDSPLMGTWRGVNEGETDSFDVEIHPLYWVSSEGEKIYEQSRFTGLPKGTMSIEDHSNISLRWYEFTGSRHENDRNGLDMSTLYGRMQEDGSIRINWDAINWDTYEKTSGTFRGNKIK